MPQHNIFLLWSSVLHINFIKMENTENPIYGCGQQTLYSASQLGWGFCNDYLPIFNGLKAKYTQAYIDQNLLNLETAENLPDAPNRQQRRSTLRVSLTKKANQCLKLWQTLKNYIVEAYPEDLHKAQFNAAGATYYAKAGTYNWAALASLLKSGNSFIVKNIADLVANDNMPKDFQATFQDAKDTCAAIVKDYFAAE